MKHTRVLCLFSSRGVDCRIKYYIKRNIGPTTPELKSLFFSFVFNIIVLVFVYYIFVFVITVTAGASGCCWLLLYVLFLL